MQSSGLMEHAPGIWSPSSGAVLPHPLPDVGPGCLLPSPHPGAAAALGTGPGRGELQQVHSETQRHRAVPGICERSVPTPAITLCPRGLRIKQQIKTLCMRSWAKDHRKGWGELSFLFFEKELHIFIWHWALQIVLASSDAQPLGATCKGSEQFLCVHLQTLLTVGSPTGRTECEVTVCTPCLPLTYLLYDIFVVSQVMDTCSPFLGEKSETYCLR